MISEKTKKWIEAGKIYAINLDSSILCPECEMSNLEAKDIINEEYPQEIERLLYCPKCEAKNFIKLKKDSTATISAGVGEVQIRPTGNF